MPVNELTRQYRWSKRTPEWIQQNPGKGTMFRMLPDGSEYIESEDVGSVVKEFKPHPNRLSGVYIIVCEKEKSVYVGQSKNIPVRLRSHKMAILNNDKSKVYTRISPHFRQHGIEGFKFEIYKYCLPECLLQEEQDAMSEFVQRGYSLYNSQVHVEIRDNSIYCPHEYIDLMKAIIARINRPDKDFERQLSALVSQ